MDTRTPLLILFFALTGCAGGAGALREGGDGQVELESADAPGAGQVRATLPLQPPGSFQRRLGLPDKAPRSSALAVVAGRPWDEPPQAALHVTISSGSVRYGTCTSMGALADGRVLRFPASRYQRDALRGDAVVEELETTLSFDQVRELAAATEAQLRICEDPFSLTSGQRQTLAKWVREWDRMRAR